MNNTAQALSQMMPNFVQGTQLLQRALISPAMVIILAGVVIRFITSRSVSVMGMTLTRLVIVILLIANITPISNQVQTVAQDATQATGFSQQGNMEQDYQTALATKYKVPQPANAAPWQWFVNPLEFSGLSMLGVAIYFFSLAACCIMFAMTIIQQILIYLEIAFAPLFLACIMVSALVPLATRYATFFVSLCIWPLGFRVVDLLMRFVVDMAVNPTNNAAIGTANGLGGALIWWVAAAVIAFFGYAFAAGIISISIVTGGSHGLGLLGPAFLGSMFALNRLLQTGSSASAAVAGAVRGGSSSTSGSGSSAPPPLPNMYKNYAVRP